MKLLLISIFFLIMIFSSTSINSETLPSSISAPIYSIFLSTPATQRYSSIIQQKHSQLTQFIQFLYTISLFKYSFYLGKILFIILPQNMIRKFLSEEFYDQCKGIANVSGKEVYEIVVYNYMYEIGSVKDFCTSVVVAQYYYDSSNSSNSMNENINNSNINNLSILARNLDYGFQQFLSSNTIQINFYQSQKYGYNKQNLKYTTITHAGFVGSHTIFKYHSQLSQKQSQLSLQQSSQKQLQSQQSQSSQLQLKTKRTHKNHKTNKLDDIKFALSLNQRSNQHLIITWINVLFFRCQSIFQLLNRVLKQQNQNLQQLVNKLVEANTCSSAYFTIHTENKSNVIIQKNSGKGAKYVDIQNKQSQNNKDINNTIYYILQTNTDHDLPDPDGRRDVARNKIQNIIQEKGYLQKESLKSILLETPNFNSKTLMTAIIDVENQIIQTLVWGFKEK